MEKHVIKEIGYDDDVAKVTLLGIPDVPGLAAEIFGKLTDCNILVGIIIQNISADGKVTDITFTVAGDDVERAVKCIRGVEKFKDIDIRFNTDVAKISAIGIGMVSNAGVANTMFQTLADHSVNIDVITTSEVKISIIIAQKDMDTAVQALHKAYGLDTGRSA